jgi:ABC-type multidrug transport system fused ATPase/permease subunit
MGHQIVVSLQESVGRVLERIATILPGLLALIVAVILFTLLGWGLAWVLRQILNAVHFDERFGRRSAQLAEWSPTQTPTSLFARIVFWAFVILGIAVGCEAFGASSNSIMAEGMLTYLPRVVGSVVILFVGTVIARFLSRSVLIGAVNMNLQYARILSLGVKWLVLVLTAAMVLDHLHIGEAIVDLAFGILFGGIVLALALSIGLGSRDLVSRSLEKESGRPAPSKVETMPEERLRHF